MHAYCFLVLQQDIVGTPHLTLVKQEATQVNVNYWDTKYSMKDKPDCDIGAPDMRIYLCEPNLESDSVSWILEIPLLSSGAAVDYNSKILE